MKCATAFVQRALDNWKCWWTDNSSWQAFYQNFTHTSERISYIADSKTFQTEFSLWWLYDSLFLQLIVLTEIRILRLNEISVQSLFFHSNVAKLLYRISMNHSKSLKICYRIEKSCFWDELKLRWMRRRIRLRVSSHNIMSWQINKCLKPIYNFWD